MTFVSVGADPEFFLKRSGHFVSGHLVELGTKSEPKKTKHGFVQNDGLAVECNVFPSTTRDGFVLNVAAAIHDLQEEVKAQDKSLEIVAIPTAKFSNKVMRELPPYVARLGCTPDFNAYTFSRQPVPDVLKAGMENTRTASGHIHLGWTVGNEEYNSEHFAFCCGLVKQLDYYIGLPSLIWDKDSVRRKLYGQPGSFRPKHYGLEYRVPSNVWTTDPKITAFIFERTKAAYEDYEKGIRMEEKYGLTAQSYINMGSSNWHKMRPELAADVLKW